VLARKITKNMLAAVAAERFAQHRIASQPDYRLC
jgi:hypothetical protein